MRKVLVTGATGFVGRRLVKRLLADGCRVRVLVRDQARLEPAVKDRLEVVRGELGDGAAAASAVSGVDTVMNLAALATAFDRDQSRYFRVNTEGLGVLLDAAAAARVGRFVQVSTIAVMPAAGGPRLRGLPRDLTPYAQSKQAAEQLVAAYVNQGGDAVIVRPARVYGPGPWNDANGTTRLAAMYLRGTFRFRLRDQGARANYVHVDDVVEGIIRAADRGTSGAVYTLGGQNATLEQYLQMVTELTGIKRRVGTIPPALMVPVSHLCQLWGRLGGTTSLTPAWLNNFLEDRPVDCSVAVRDLDYHPRGLREGLRQTLAWLMTTSEGKNHGEQNSCWIDSGQPNLRLRKYWA